MAIDTFTCPGCQRAFSMQDIVDAHEVEPIGMQFVDDDFEWNMYYFNHVCDACGTTFVIPVESFLPLITEPIPESVLAGTDRCERHCMKLTDLRACSQPCHYAPFRRFLIGLLATKKLHPAPGRRE